MFTGIVTDIGRVRQVETRGETKFVLATGMDLGDLEIGASVACSGPCLTVVDKGHDWFAVEASAETLRRTTLADWHEGHRVNLERALRIGQELGGHIVTGHVDAVVHLVDRQPEGDSVGFVIEVPAALGRFIAEKGSVALDGVSLTVNEVADNAVDGTARFGVNIIPHTATRTTLGSAEAGDRMNMEIDMMARYAARLLAADGD